MKTLSELYSLNHFFVISKDWKSLGYHVIWDNPHMWHYKYGTSMCKLSRVDLTTVSLGNPRMKIPSLCTWTFVADNTSCQPLWKKHAENHPNTNAESLGNMKPLGFLLSFLWEMSIMHFATKAKNGKFGKDTCQLTITLGTILYELFSTTHGYTNFSR